MIAEDDRQRHEPVASRRHLLLATLGVAWLGWPSRGAVASASTDARPARVVSLGGGVTEIVYALGAADHLVAVDDSSVYPEAAQALPKVGYYRSTPIEGVAAMRPDLVLASSQAGPADALQRLRQLGIPVVVVPDQPTLPALEGRIRAVAEALAVPERGAALVAGLRQALAHEVALAASSARAVFLMQRGGRWLAAGSTTAAHATLGLAGITNVLADQVGYKAVSGEALAALAPELIVTTTLSVAEAGGVEALRALPGIATTPAARARRIVVLDDLLALGFSLRLPEALAQLRDGVVADER